MSLEREKMANVDTAWWHMEAPTNLMMITAVMVFEGELDYEKLYEIIEKRMLAYDRFRQRVIDPAVTFGQVSWELDPYFDLSAHIRRVALPSPGDKGELENLVSDLMSTPLDYNKPLWQMHIVENYGDGFAVINRLHHCIADGIALMRVLLSLTDDSPDAVFVEEEERERGRRGLLRGAFGPAIGIAKTTGRVSGTMVRESVKTVRHPGRIVDAARYGVDFTARLGKITLRWPDPPTLFKGELSVRKQAAWSDAVSLAEVKAIGQATGGTVNDVMVTAVTGALRRYMEVDREAQTAGLSFRAYIPFNLRPLDQKIELGNKFGLVFLQLPVGTVDKMERLQIIKQRMDELKNSTEPEVAITLLATAGMLPKDIETQVFKLFHAKATAVLTNVPGPQQPLYMAGGKLRTMMGWVPQAGNLGLGLSIISYDGQVFVGINTDAGLVPDAGRVIEHFYTEFEEMKGLVE